MLIAIGRVEEVSQVPSKVRNLLNESNFGELVPMLVKVSSQLDMQQVSFKFSSRFDCLPLESLVDTMMLSNS